MEKRGQQPQHNDERQSGTDGNLAYGQDARMFGQGGQKIQRALDSRKDDRPERDTERDESLPVGQHPSRSER
jgi:hypothetical protein